MNALRITWSPMFSSRFSKLHFSDTCVSTWTSLRLFQFKMDIDTEPSKCEVMHETEPTQKASHSSSLPGKEEAKNPTCVIILGMAGSGKSSLCSKLVGYLHGKNTPPYVINCDPACMNTDYLCNVDIRDTVHYKNVMQKYGLGPNGSIITSLNLFVTNFDQVLTLIDKRKDKHK